MPLERSSILGPSVSGRPVRRDAPRGLSCQGYALCVPRVTPTPLPLFRQVLILKSFKSFVLEVRILKGLRAYFGEVRILKGLAGWGGKSWTG
jgi:hypothetical protein